MIKVYSYNKDLDITWNTENPDFTQCFHDTTLTWTPCAIFWVLSTIETYRIIQSKRVPLSWTFLNITKFDLDITWNTENPDFTQCFHDTTLTWTPCAIFWVLSTIETYRIIQSKRVPLSWTFLNITKFILSASLIYYERLKGLHTSVALFTLWLLLTITSSLNYRTLLSIVFRDEGINEKTTDLVFITQMAYCPIIICQFILSCFADPIVTIKDRNYKVEECPRNRASILSILTFWWVNPLVRLGHKRPLTLMDMWSPNEEFITEYNLKNFNRHYYKSYPKSKIFPISGSNFNVVRQENEIKRSPGILIPLMKTYWRFVIVLVLFRLSSALITFINPTVLDWFITFMSDSSQPIWRGFLYCFALLGQLMLSSLVSTHSMYYSQLMRLKMRACISNTIYKKSLVLSTDGRKSFTIGEIVNLMAMDTHRVVEFVWMVNMMWSMVLQISIAIYLLWLQLGVSTLVGVGILLCLMPINGVVATRLKILQTTLMKVKDKRVKLMNDILSGIRVWKMYAWEQSFNEKVMSLRNSEISKLVTRAFYNCFIMFTHSSAQVLVSVFTFAVYVMIDKNNVLNANVAFVSLTLFGILGAPLTMIPNLITSFVMFTVSLKRINKYLISDELDSEAIEHNQQVMDPIVVENASFSWSKSDVIPILSNISLNVKHNKLVAIVGQVGSGKSSLLSAILGDMIKTDGIVNMNGTIAYVPQQAYIMNTTLKSNILFSKEMDRKKFDKVLDACALRPDLDILPGGEETEIGAKGINLSGGQKQRVSMARACYANADIYLFDDPISALDAHVGKHVFDKVIGSNGLLRHKTRVLVTHRISVLPNVDEIVVIKDGSISEFGTYRELLDRRGNFADFLINYLENTTDIPDTEDMELIEEIADKIKPGLQRLISTQKSTISDDGLRKRTLSDGSKSGLFEKPKEDLDEEKAKKGKLTEAEASETGSVKLSVYLDYLKKIGIWSLIAVFLSDVILSALTFASSLWLAEWSDDSLDPIKRLDESLRNVRLGVYGALGGGQTVFTFVATISITLACLNGSKILHNEMLVRMMRAPVSHFDTTPVGRILNRFSKDVDISDTVLGMSIRNAMTRLFACIVSFAIIGYETPYVLLVIFPLGFVYYIIQQYYISTSRQLRRIESNARSPVIGHFTETLSGISSIRAYDMSKYFINEFSLLVDTHHNTTYESTAANRWLAIRLEFLGYCIVFIDALFVVLTRDSVTPGMAGLTLTYAMKITFNLNSVVNAMTTLETDIVSVERCIEYTQTPTEAEWHRDGTKPSDDWPQNGLIEFKKYSTRYREGLDLVLKDIDLTINGGQRVGVVGRTGAGKSSLTLALFRLIEPSIGTIAIDSVDVTNIGLYELRSKIIATKNTTAANRWLAIRLEFLGYCIVFIDALFVVLTRDSVTPGMAGLTLTYAMKITFNLNSVVNAMTTLETDIVSVERCIEYTQTPTEAEWHRDGTKPSDDWPQNGLIEFKKYSTRYREGLDLVLKDIDLTINGGQRVGVVGRTGAGKSSLTLALFRLIEPSIGTIAIDSVDVTNIGLYELRSKLTVIPQDPVLFTGTLRDNLDPFQNHSDEELWTSLELAHLKTFVSSLTEKLDYPISEGGSNLSVGQKQLLCLARALLRKSRILVLDEATAAVDVETDDLIQKTIREEFNEVTIITIAHRLNTILDYDKILVMDSGCVKEYDSPKALLDNHSSQFHSMAKDAGLV
ncbi:unnamed protein product [Medioppia subpectinata]|uniref:ABC-type glutathione-S-conjugate transporter n=1 Tax=Medioppia subpectinata TaxID=1979941 RepID=A0A7R9KPW6_9ACAR|nr:unnamed protein product [Medioppia subpectinata]CAG2107605.1 unnamed protein product [Medioppia subpectinata]